MIINKAVCLAELGKYDESLEELEKVLIHNPDDFDGYPLRKDYPRLGRKERDDFPVVDRGIQKKNRPQ